MLGGQLARCEVVASAASPEEANRRRKVVAAVCILANVLLTCVVLQAERVMDP